MRLFVQERMRPFVRVLRGPRGLRNASLLSWTEKTLASPFKSQRNQSSGRTRGAI